MNAPELLLLNLQNSLSEADRPHISPVCHLSFNSPYWVNNRTDMDLILRDHASAAPNTTLLGYKTPLDYAEVIAPGNSLEVLGAPEQAAATVGPCQHQNHSEHGERAGVK